MGQWANEASLVAAQNEKRQLLGMYLARTLAKHDGFAVRRTPYTKSTDPRSPTPEGSRIAGDMKGPLRPDLNGNM